MCMVKKICFFTFLFFCLILNIVIDCNIKNYFLILSDCFGNNIVLTNNSYVFICIILALISILIVLDILLVFFKKQTVIKGISLNSEDGTHGTANWMSEDEITSVLTFDKPGIVLGKYNNKIVKLPFESYFNKNICVFRKFTEV